MNDTITIHADSFKRFIYCIYHEDFAKFARRYFNFGEELANEIFHTVVEEFYLKVKAGEMEVWENTKRDLEKLGTQVVLKFLRNRLPDLTVVGIPEG